MVVFLGDYIYEYASRRPNVAVRTHSLRHARSLNDYREPAAVHGQGVCGHQHHGF